MNIWKGAEYMRRFCDYIDTVETTERILKDYCRQMHRAEKGDPCALEYFSQLMPAFNHLSEAERFILSARYIDQDKNHTRKIIQKYRISKSEAYNRANEAVRHLARLIFW